MVIPLKLSLNIFCCCLRARSRIGACLGNHLHVMFAGSPSLVPTSEVINFASKLLGNSHMKLYRSALKMPSLILDNKEKIASRFISNNGLVEDPSTAEKERCMVNPWTSKEKEMFLDRLTTFGKDFRKIASFLDHKTTADCVEFYYKNHKSDCFQGTKKKTEFPKPGKSCLTSTFLVTSGKRQASISSAASLDMLGAGSVIVAHVEDKLTDQQKCPRKRLGDDGNCMKSSNPDVLGNERETIASDMLAGICGSLSSEAMGSCITSSMDFGEGYQDRKSPSSVRLPLTPEGTHNVVSETCSDESCGEIDPTNWTDEEKSSFIQAVTSYGKDFTMISQYVRTRSSDQCKVFFSKARKCLRLDKVMHPNQRTPTSDDAKDGGVCDDDVNACVVESICSEKSGSRIAEDQLSSNFKENLNGRQPAMPAIVSSKQCNSCKSHNPMVQSRKRLDRDMASQFDSGKFSKQQCQNSFRTDNHHKNSCESSSLDLVDPSQIFRGSPVSITMKNGINGSTSCTKPVSARSKLNVVEHFSAQRCHLQKCSSSKHLDAESELHRLPQCHSKDLPVRSFGFRA